MQKFATTPPTGERGAGRERRAPPLHRPAPVEATLSLVSVAVDNEALLRRTLEHYGRRSMDWPDAYLVALVELRHLDGLVSFDRLDAKLAGSP